MGQQMKNIGSFSKKTKTGFEQTVTQYQAQNCKGCSLRGLCFKGKGNRIIQKNYNVARHRIPFSTSVSYSKAPESLR
ncbi:transposase [Tenacibaculum sp. 190524A02b]